jgi:transposase
LEARVEAISNRRLRCGRCGRKAVHRRGRMRERRWRDLFVLGYPLVIVYAPYRVSCPRCGVRVERVPWAPRWGRFTKPLGCAVAELARRMNWRDVARYFRLDWKTVLAVVRWAVDYGLRKRELKTLHYLGIDEVSRRKGHYYLSLFYDLGRKKLLYLSENRDENSVRTFFQWLGKRRSGSIREVCMDMWKPYSNVVREMAKKAVIVFDRFHLVRHLNEAVDEVRREMVRELVGPQAAMIKRTRYLWLKNHWNLKGEERMKMRDLLQENMPIVKAYLLKEAFQKFWRYQSKGHARNYLRRWFWLATHSRLKPMIKFAKLVKRHEEGILAWIDSRISNGALEGMANKIKTVAKRAYGFRKTEHYMLAIYHCCAELPLPKLR